MTSKNTSYPTTAHVNAIRLFADNLWTSPSTMAQTGHLYSYDTSKNATFPAYLYALKLFENNVSLENKYLKLSGGTLTGALILTEQSSVWNTVNIKGSTKESTIGFNEDGMIGFKANVSSSLYENSFTFRVGDTNKLRIGALSIRPETTDSYDCGTSTQQWNNIYGKTIYENGTALSSKYLAKSAFSLNGTTLTLTL